ncbi:glycerol kinase [Aureobasidium pullulans]|nr:glycerol kinase [Aureobasidium pullulans]THZ50854.1 glycerol kinase [Aureobasidium pullulans]
MHGWHEQDPEDLFCSVTKCIERCLEKLEEKGFNATQIVSLGITNQRETVVVWDTLTGKPLCHAVVWGDVRTAALVREFEDSPGSNDIQTKTGLPLSTYSSALKLVWLLRHDGAVRAAYYTGRLAFGTVDTWLVYKLNGGPSADVLATDSTNASRTGFMNLQSRQYDADLLKFYSIDFDFRNIQMPTIYPSSHPSAFGKVCFGGLQGVPITACLGDQSAALIGHKGFKDGSAKCTFGTGCFLLYNTGKKPVYSTHGLLTTLTYDFGDDYAYALEGSIATAGSGVNFLVENLGFGETPGEVSALAGSVVDSGGVVFVTAFSGLFAPYWIDNAQGTIFGITMNTQRAHIARAVLEAVSLPTSYWFFQLTNLVGRQVSFQSRAVLNAMALDSGIDLGRLGVDGGLSQSDVCMQLQADIVEVDIVRPSMCEVTALGACFAAGLGVGLWKNPAELEKVQRSEPPTIFRAQMD